MGEELIEIEVQKPLEWSRVLKIKVSPERIESQREKIVQSLRKKARIPGFRHGKAPIKPRSTSATGAKSRGRRSRRSSTRPSKRR